MVKSMEGGKFGVSDGLAREKGVVEVMRLQA